MNRLTGLSTLAFPSRARSAKIWVSRSHSIRIENLMSLSFHTAPFSCPGCGLDSFISMPGKGA